jgi:hypothetical protein
MTDDDGERIVGVGVPSHKMESVAAAIRKAGKEKSVAAAKPAVLKEKAKAPVKKCSSRASLITGVAISKASRSNQSAEYKQLIASGLWEDLGDEVMASATAVIEPRGKISARSTHILLLTPYSVLFKGKRTKPQAGRAAKKRRAKKPASPCSFGFTSSSESSCAESTDEEQVGAVAIAAAGAAGGPPLQNSKGGNEEEGGNEEDEAAEPIEEDHKEHGESTQEKEDCKEWQAALSAAGEAEHAKCDWWDTCMEPRPAYELMELLQRAQAQSQLKSQTRGRSSSVASSSKASSSKTIVDLAHAAGILDIAPYNIHAFMHTKIETITASSSRRSGRKTTPIKRLATEQSYHSFLKKTGAGVKIGDRHQASESEFFGAYGKGKGEHSGNNSAAGERFPAAIALGQPVQAMWDDEWLEATLKKVRHTQEGKVYDVSARGRRGKVWTVSSDEIKIESEAAMACVLADSPRNKPGSGVGEHATHSRTSEEEMDAEALRWQRTSEEEMDAEALRWQRLREAVDQNAHEIKTPAPKRCRTEQTMTVSKEQTMTVSKPLASRLASRFLGDDKGSSGSGHAGATDDEGGSHDNEDDKGSSGSGHAGATDDEGGSHDSEDNDDDSTVNMSALREAAVKIEDLQSTSQRDSSSNERRNERSSSEPAACTRYILRQTNGAELFSKSFVLPGMASGAADAQVKFCRLVDPSDQLKEHTQSMWSHQVGTRCGDDGRADTRGSRCNEPIKAGAVVLRWIRGPSISMEDYAMGGVSDLNANARESSIKPITVIGKHDSCDIVLSDCKVSDNRSGGARVKKTIRSKCLLICILCIQDVMLCAPRYNPSSLIHSSSTFVLRFCHAST